MTMIIMKSFHILLEINNEKFEIQISNNGSNFLTIGSILGNGNSTTEIDYTFEDKNPISGTNYYRLKQVDYDSHFEYSKIIRIQNSNFDLKIYPSVGSFLVVDISNIESATMYFTRVTGENILIKEIGDGLNVIDVSELTTGIYFITVSVDGVLETQKIFIP
jgi:hypothetical protein